MKKILTCLALASLLFANEAQQPQEQPQEQSKEQSKEQEAIKFYEVDLSKKPIPCHDPYNPILKWLFSGSDIGVSAIFNNITNTVISSFDLTMGFRYNFQSKAPEFISARGFSLATRVGVSYVSYDTFRYSGVAIPIEAELTYAFSGGLFLGAGANFTYIPFLGNYEALMKAEGYAEIGFANHSGGAIRIGYVFYSNGMKRQSDVKIVPMEGSITASLRFKL